MQFIDPKTDFAFKKIFGNEKAPEILIDFIESVLELEGDKKIRSVIIIDPYQAPKIKELKHSFLDVKCTDHRGIQYVVEMQVEYVKGFIKRTVYNTSKAYVNQIEKGSDYPKLNQVISINILNFKTFDDPRIRYLSHHQTVEVKTSITYIDELSYHFIELPKFTKKEEELENNLEKWCYFLKHAGDLDNIPKTLEVEPFIRAFDIANRANMTKQEWEYYDASTIIIQDRIGAIEAAYEKGETSGLEKGELIGQVLLLQKLKQVHKYSREELISFSIEELSRILRELTDGSSSI